MEAIILWRKFMFQNMHLQMKRSKVKKIKMLVGNATFTYQGDGDLAAIGTAETIHACNRGENIVMIFVNNAIYGMTGGQMAPTTLVGMKTVTTPYGRRIDLNGYPLQITELVSELPGTYYVTRQSVETAAAVRKAKKAVRQAFENQKNHKGTSFVEFVSTCNSGWKMTPVAANKWMEDNMFQKYIPGDIKVDGKMVLPVQDRIVNQIDVTNK